MRLRLLHRRLAIGMGLAGLVAFAGGAGFEPVAATLAAAALVGALFWQPDAVVSDRLEKVLLPVATVLVVRALIHVSVIRDDVVIPVVDLLLLLMAAEAYRDLESANDVRLYALSFALILASTAYRPGIVFLVAFLAYVGLSTLALMVGHLRRRADLHGVREIPVEGGLMATTGLLSGVIMLVALVVFVTFPRVSQGWAGRGEVLATSIAGFSEEVSLGSFGSSIRTNPEIVLRVEFPAGRPADIASLHWRGRSYDRFDGVRWTRSRRLPPSAGPTRWYAERWPGPVLEQQIFSAPLDVRVLFAPHPVLDIRPTNGIQPLFDNAGDFEYWGNAAPAYRVISRIGRPPAERLRAAEEGYTPSDRYYLQLPRNLDPRIAQLADSITRGLRTRYDKVVAVERWLQSLTYTRDLPATARDATLEAFLFRRRAGHCEYFSTAMAVMLRTLGIHARNVNGFLGGEWSQFGDYLVVTQNAAHSWVEVWFPGYGWVTFDPTPAGAAVTETATAWFWPGRIFFDGLQHRWNKWVLDYSVEDQIGLFSGWGEFFQRREEAGGPAGGPSTTRSRPYLLALGLLALVALALYVGRLRGTVPPESRAYLRLRAAAGRAGLDVPPGLTPLALVERIGRAAPAAAPHARAVVDAYLRVRFGGQAAGEEERRALAARLRQARRALRTAAGGTSKSVTTEPTLGIVQG